MTMKARTTKGANDDGADRGRTATLGRLPRQDRLVPL